MADMIPRSDTPYVILKTPRGVEVRFELSELPLYVQEKVQAIKWNDLEDTKQAILDSIDGLQDATRTLASCKSNPYVGPVRVTVCGTKLKETRNLIGFKKVALEMFEEVRTSEPLPLKASMLNDDIGFLASYLHLIAISRAESGMESLTVAVNSVFEDWVLFERRPMSISLANAKQCNVILRYYRARRSVANDLSKVLDLVALDAIAQKDKATQLAQALLAKQQKADESFLCQLAEMESGPSMQSGTLVEMLAVIGDFLVRHSHKNESSFLPQVSVSTEEVLNGSAEMVETPGYLGSTEGEVLQDAKKLGFGFSHGSAEHLGQDQ